jgi:catechol 2,3-dioxygenase-like lactoylglutathione lyase family enzyme
MPLSGDLALGGLRLHHTSIVVRDVDAAARFAHVTWGFEVTFEARGMTSQIRSMLGLRGIWCDLIQGATPGSQHVTEFIAFFDIPADRDLALPVAVGQGHVAFITKDLAQSLAAVRAAGGRQLGAVTQFAEGRAAYCLMPSGGVIEIEELDAAVTEGTVA